MRVSELRQKLKEYEHEHGDMLVVVGTSTEELEIEYCDTCEDFGKYGSGYLMIAVK